MILEETAGTWLNLSVCVAPTLLFACTLCSFVLEGSEWLSCLMKVLCVEVMPF